MGRHQVLVVNHGNEQIEFFELVAAGAESHLDWKGCAKPGNDAFMNDVGQSPRWRVLCDPYVE